MGLLLQFRLVAAQMFWNYVHRVPFPSPHLRVQKASSAESNWTRMRPLLIAFEGGDRCGKSTQLDHLYFFLKNNLRLASVIKLKHPDRSTPTGRIIDQFLKREVDLPTEAMTLLLSSNLWDTR